MISRFLGRFRNKDHPEEFQASFYYSLLGCSIQTAPNKQKNELKTNRMAMTHSSHARPYLQSRWKALACPTLITITFMEEAVPPPARLGRYGWRRWQPNPPVTAEIWGNRQKMHRTQLIKVESQMCNNTGVQTLTYRAQEYQNHRHTNPTPPPSHSHTEANGGASIFDTKMTSSFCLNIWFSSQHVATSILTRPISRETFAFSNSDPPSCATLSDY